MKFEEWKKAAKTLYAEDGVGILEYPGEIFYNDVDEYPNIVVSSRGWKGICAKDSMSFEEIQEFLYGAYCVKASIPYDLG